MIVHHPSNEMLSAYASGALVPGEGLVVACHLERCALCAQTVADFESLGGCLLEKTQSEALSEGALARVLAAIDRPGAMAEERNASVPGYLARFDLPQTLRRQTIGPRQWLTPSIWFAPVNLSPRASARTYLVYGRKNTSLPRHTHAGRELTAVLAGGYRDTLGDFDAGDFVETDETVLHAPSVTTDDACLCLITSDGPMKLRGFLARLVQICARERY